LAAMEKPSPYKRLREHEITGQFVRYALIGCFNVAISLSIFTILGRSVPATSVAFLVSNTISFFLNKHWAFKDAGADVARQYVVFFLFTAVGLGLIVGQFALYRIPLRRYGVAGHYAAYLASIPLVVLWNFTAYRRWTFRGARSTAAPGGSAGA
jgi:putative flippase GtrA